ncbi:hypothetical protein S40285_09198 [Stachybotrys chlorohalonatus IBT 40285]|uniref:NACHT domain-containing protein n=1 Tax=Stachybotrys chlorohalonatus (strain IBT 40285) TaxID=1283841 RepID=A0A084QRU3_STAC4|nr:hypothetical protein S40285_09198 [Stachybotrys chlorohalonata IBT 40285]
MLVVRHANVREPSPAPSATSGASQAQPSSTHSLPTRRPSDSDALEGSTLGLNVVYTPNNGHKADIIFIHGLGGTSRNTWTKSKDPDCFWPLTFLALEPDLCLARILTFGYNAALRKAGNISTSMLDFAKDLLFDLKYATDEQKGDLHMGNAYMQGQHDPDYAHIIKAVTAITFLATPHRGTNFAQTLNRILQTTVVSNSKQYIAELGRNSLSLQKLNEQFRHIAPKLQVVSFYETRPTPIGLKNTRLMILEKDSSVLGYPGETSKALDADHNGVCKYDSPNDPNYIAVRNILKSIVSKIVSAKNPPKKTTVLNRRNSMDLKVVLSLTDLPTMDYSFFRDQWLQGTSDWILKENAFREWKNPVSASAPSLLWINGGPATGKSVMASFVINDLVEEDACCQYFFIKFGDRKKRTLSLLLRSIAYQVAQSVPELFTRIEELEEEGMQFSTADSRIIWERVFKCSLFEMKDEQRQPLFWIIDGLDESENPRSAIKLLSDIVLSKLPIRILLLSRKSHDIEASFQRLPKSLSPEIISMEDRQDNDLRQYVHEELHVPGSPDFRKAIAERILEGAKNNFLWVRLAVEKVNSCHRESDVEFAFQQLPDGMESLYNRMAREISQIQSPADRELAKTILQFTNCAFRPLSIMELAEALGERSTGVLDLQRTVMDLCCGFVVVDNSSNVTMVHQTAREYLLGDQGYQLSLDRNTAHEQLFLSCMRCLLTVGLRAKMSRKMPEFFDYAATSWPAHLSMIRLNTLEVAQMLKKFMTGAWILTWIEYLATAGQLGTLIQASKHLSKYALKLRKHDAAETAGQMHLVELELLESWAVDLIKIIGKFPTLRQNPSSVYKLIPPFCPRDSSIYQLFGKAESRNIQVSGLSTRNWDDLTTRITLRDGAFASSISVAGPRIFVLTSSGDIYVFDASTFEESSASLIKQKERLYMFQVSANGSLIATYGYRTTKVFEASTGNCTLSVSNIKSRPRPLVMQFAKKNTQLIIGFDDSNIRLLDLTVPNPDWQLQSVLEETELDGHFLNASNYMALNQDGSLIAVAYRGHPLSAWEADGPMHIGHCWRKRDASARGEVIDATWLPQSPEILGLYIEGVVFKWSPYENEVEEIATGANRLTINRDGTLFATGDGKGTVKVFTTSGFSLLYHLASQDSVFDIAFSPDSHRFYDIRGHYANVWEPNALLSFSEQTNISGSDRDSDSESIGMGLIAQPTVSPRVDAITVLASSPKGKLYFSGTESGAVQVHHTQKGRLADVHTSNGFLSIEQMSCSTDGNYLAYCDSSKKITIKAIILNATSNADLVVETKAVIAMKGLTRGHILSLLFHPSSLQLLVHTSSSLHIISLSTYEIVHSKDQPGAMEQIFIQHPQDPSQIIAFGWGTIQILDWDLRDQLKLVYETGFGQIGAPDSCDAPNAGEVEDVVVTRDKEHILMAVSHGKPRTKDKILLYFVTSSLTTTTTSLSPCEIVETNSEIPAAISPRVLPTELGSKVSRILSFLSQDRLIFLSRTFSICSYQLPSGPAKVLFTLPGDWISQDCLALCRIWAAEKSFLCPKNGEVAAVRCAALT